MAATTISHNKPTAGSISWTAFSIAYAGVSYTVPASSSSAKFVWWEYNGGTPVLRSGDLVPDLTPDDTLLFLNKKGIGLLLPEASVVDGSLIVEESIYASAIAADQINGKHIASEAITADHIQAGSITAEQLSVGTVSGNLVANGSFEDVDADGNIIGWQANTMTGGTMTPVTGVASSGAVSIQFDATSTSANLRLGQKPEHYIPVSNASSRRWYVSARAGVGTAVSKGLYLRVLWHDANKKFISNVDVQSNRPVTTTFSIFEGQAAPPAAARFMSVEIIFTLPNVASKLYVDEVTVNQVVVAANIGDGQISTAKLAAKSVTADKLVIRDSTNFLIDGGFESNGAGWSLGTGNTIVTLTDAQTREGAVGTKVLQLVGNGTIKETTADSFPVEPGEWYYASAWVRATEPSTSTGTVGLSSTITREGLGNTYPDFKNYQAKQITPEWMLVEGQLQIPAKALRMSIRCQVRNNTPDGTFQFDDVTLRRMNGGELVVDGAIKTNHMIANSISGDVIAANTIYGTKMVADSITSRELLATEIWANNAWISAIRGKKITGATLETEDAVNRGVKITTAKGLQVFNTAGVEMLTADSNGVSVEGAFSATAQNGAVKLSATLPGAAVPTRYNAGLEFTGAEKSYQGRIYSGFGIDGINLEGSNHSNNIKLGDAGTIVNGRTTTLNGIEQLVLNGPVNKGVTISHGNIPNRRLPLGIMSHYKSSTALTLSTNTQICLVTLLVPAAATVRVTLHLRGYPSENGQILQLDAFAGGELFGSHNHYSPTRFVGTDGTAVFHYTSTSTVDKSVSFRLAGTTSLPSTSTYIVPAVTTMPQVEVVIEDLGTLP